MLHTNTGREKLYKIKLLTRTVKVRFPRYNLEQKFCIRFEVIKAMEMYNVVFWVVTSSGLG
jgi:hypothetical protein